MTVMKTAPDTQVASATMLPATASALPGGAVVAISDARGGLTLGTPKAGFRDFAAPGAGPYTECEGTGRSRNAAIRGSACALK